MKYEIIEDCSPYYIRYTHEGISDIIDYCNECTPKFNTHPFVHHMLPEEKATKMLSLIPASKQLELMNNRVSLFISKPGLHYRAHKDGMDHRFSINYVSKVLDDKCITSWYSDDDLKDNPIDKLLKKASRECVGFVKENHTPLKSMIAKQN
jgi:hypothetical protein